MKLQVGVNEKIHSLLGDKKKVETEMSGDRLSSAFSHF